MKKENYYDIIKKIDIIIKKKKPNKSDFHFIYECFQDISYYRYFFKKFDNPVWFDYLNKFKVFADIPEPQLTEDGKNIEYPRWWPGQYLIKVADKIPDKVLELLKRIKADNHQALIDIIQIVINLPVKYSKQLLPQIEKWINIQNIGAITLLDKMIVDLLYKFITEKELDTSLELFSILIKPKKGERENAKVQFKSYYLQKIFEEVLPKLIDQRCKHVLNIITKRLKEAISIENKNNIRKDGSFLWRPAIEDSDQNWTFDEIKGILAVVLRNVLYQFVKKFHSKANKVIEGYLKENYSIFNRIAIHTIRVCNIDNMAKNLLIKKENLHQVEIYHEYFILVEEKFNILNSNQKKIFIKWILEGPVRKLLKKMSDEEFKHYTRRWQIRVLTMLKKYLEKDKDLKKYKHLLKDYKDDFLKIEHPAFLSYHTSWSGPTSPPPSGVPPGSSNPISSVISPRTYFATCLIAFV